MADSGQRLLVPDLARGVMLLFIAAANTHYWFRRDPDAPEAIESLISSLSSLLIDARVYPLFALLLGFGLATLADRSIRTELATGLDRGQAEQRTTSLLRRRGLWLMAFGVVHALIFAQDILGVYGLITIVVAGIVTTRRRWAALILAGTVCVLSTLFLLLVGPEAALTRRHGSAAQALFEEGLTQISTNLVVWTVSTPATVMLSMALPSALLGAWMAGRGSIERPHRFRPRLTALFLVGFVVPTIVTPMLWAGTNGSGPFAHVLIAWHQGVAGLLAGVAYLALISLTASHHLTGTGVLGRALAATGKRALTVYLSQTVLMVLIAGVLRLGGIDALALSWQLLVAVVSWAVPALLCSLTERHGTRGPAEQLLRHLMTTNTRK